MINEGKKYFMLKENIRSKGNQLGNIKWGRLVKHGKSIGQNERQSLKLRIEVQDEGIKFAEIIRQCHHIVQSAKIIQRVKTQKSQRLKIGK